MPSVFSKIISGELPCYKIAETDEFLAFLDVFPLVKGHTLVVPKIEIDYLFELSDEVLARMILFAKEVAIKVEKVIPCERIGVAVIGLEVAHAHIHLVPINNADDLNFTRPKINLPKEEMELIANKITKQII
jgi:histidine triad (HIT) family protein